MTLKEFLDTNPSREQVATIICNTCNYNQIHVKEMEDIEFLCDKFNININYFYDNGSEFEKCYVGVYNWQYNFLKD